VRNGRLCYQSPWLRNGLTEGATIASVTAPSNPVRALGNPPRATGLATLSHQERKPASICSSEQLRAHRVRWRPIVGQNHDNKMRPASKNKTEFVTTCRTLGSKTGQWPVRLIVRAKVHDTSPTAINTLGIAGSNSTAGTRTVRNRPGNRCES